MPWRAPNGGAVSISYANGLGSGSMATRERGRKTRNVLSMVTGVV